MDAASYAAQRNQQIADNALRAIQMLMQGKQYQQERQWQQGQFDYKKDQDKIDNDRQAAQSAALTDYYKSMSAYREQPKVADVPREVQIAQWVKEHPEATPAELKAVGAYIEPKAPKPTLAEIEGEANARAKGGGTGKYAPKTPRETTTDTFARNKELEFESWGVNQKMAINAQYDKQLSDNAFLPGDMGAKATGNIEANRSRALAEVDKQKQVKLDALNRALKRTPGEVKTGYKDASGKPVSGEVRTDGKGRYFAKGPDGNPVEVFKE